MRGVTDEATVSALLGVLLGSTPLGVNVGRLRGGGKQHQHSGQDN